MTRIAVSLGDPAGIGPEIVSRAVHFFRGRRSLTFSVVGDEATLERARIPRACRLPLPPAFQFRGKNPGALSGRISWECVRKAVGLLQEGRADALVTAPICKEAWRRAGIRFEGHTEALKALTGAKRAGMLMVSGPLRVLLVTRHCPLQNVPGRLQEKTLREAAELADAFGRSRLKLRRPRLVLCALNPHAGENGLIGKEEKTFLKPLADRLRREGFRMDGPIAADSVFADLKEGRWDIALALYHDQGMIPLKMHDRWRMVNVTLGLPFTRTSPAHGTAFDIAGKGIASPGPMIEAIRLAARFR